MALELGMDEGGAEHVAIVVTEACTNLLKHASGGQILLQTTTEESDGAPLAGAAGGGSRSRDEQPGAMPAGRLQHRGPVRARGWARSSGMSKQSDIYTAPGKGTVVLARWWRSRNGWKPAVCRSHWRRECPQARRGSVRRRLGLRANWRRSRDIWWPMAWATAWKPGWPPPKPSGSSMRIPSCPPKALLTRVHQALRSTRGAAVAMAQIDRDAGQNDIRRRRQYFRAHLRRLREPAEPGIAERHGRPSMRANSGVQLFLARRWAAGSAFRRLSTATGLESYPGLAARDPALIAGVLYRDFCRGRDDATVVVAKAA